MEWNIKELVKEYAPPKDDDLLFTEEDDKTVKIKEIIGKLPSYDRTIILMFAELGSLRALAKELNVSHEAVTKKMDQLKRKILDEYYEWEVKILNNKIDKLIKK